MMMEETTTTTATTEEQCRAVTELGREKRSRGSDLPRIHSGVLCWCLVLLLQLSLAASRQPIEKFLNSPVHCGHGDSQVPWHKVDRYSLYNIKDDVSPHTRTGTFLKVCEMVFRSTSSDGRLCVFQRQLQFDNDNMVLRLFDGQPGVDGKTEADRIVNLDNPLVSVEWCTTGRFLTLEMAPRTSAASAKDTEIDLMIYHMSSIHRQAFLDSSPSCSSRFEMDHSKINVTNMDTRMPVLDLHWMCSLEFEYKGHEENRTLCTIFIPVPGVNTQCQVNYTLQVFEFVQEGEKSRRMLAQEGGCSRPFPERWCSNSTKISLRLSRHAGQEIEKEALFHVLVMDHHGGPETLPLLEKEAEDIPAKGIFVIALSVAGGVLVGVIIMVMVLLVLRRRQSRKSREKANGEATEDMLKNRTQNGQNHYGPGPNPV
ncbi:uncharacterized protein LOC143287733 isoform X2 [Babylonia areolata]|uniref:uncharacterized protein LOC143287733 isoform X2 n=1 Tax=Babylonia areolata TaxID=304850 RepID=UPI003FD256B7